MTIAVTLLMSSGDPDPTWTLTPEQEQEFLDRIEASPVPSVSGSALPDAARGYAGIMARDGGGERWVVYRGWIRGGANSRTDDRRVLERWLLKTGQATITPKLFAELSKADHPSRLRGSRSRCTGVDFSRPPAAVPLTAPRIGTAQDNRVLKFVPQADVAILDPIWTTAYVTRNHGYMIFDTLFGTDGAFKPSPQMAAGMTTENGGRLVKITLRGGLKFHDGTPVLARDCAASIERWSKRDTFGQTLIAVTDELTSPDDKTIQFRLKKPFPLLPDALGKITHQLPGHDAGETGENPTLSPRSLK